MEHSDISQRFVINHSGIRGQWTLLDNSFQEVLAKHDYPMEIQALLGEMMAAATLLIATLKFEGSMIIQARGEGPVSLATVECTHNHQLRAVARWQGQTQGMNFTELAVAAGFYDQPHLNRTLRAMFDSLPSRYARGLPVQVVHLKE